MVRIYEWLQKSKQNRCGFCILVWPRFVLLSGNGLKLSGSLGWNQLSLHCHSVGLPRFRGSVVRKFCLAKFFCSFWFG